MTRDLDADELPPPPEPDALSEWPEAEEPRRPVDRVHDAKGRV